jgi:N-acetylglutamate synthase-like GNAT family acetyltransferase
MSDQFKFRRADEKDRKAIEELIFHSTNDWYQKHFNKNIFGGDSTTCRIFTEVYEDLDPGCCLIAEDQQNGKIAGSCFFHPRETHLSIGIMNAHPDYFGKGVAKMILDQIINIAFEKNLPVRLVSSAMNLDSFSLYTRRGFVPRMTFQDMILDVPENGLLQKPPEGIKLVRDATIDDIPQIAELEFELNGIKRKGDYEYFVKNDSGYWGVSVFESTSGKIEGFLCSINSNGSKMLGPGIMRDINHAESLIYHELDSRHRGNTPVFLIPVHEGELVKTLYQWGARNCEMHLCQVLGDCPQMNGITMPTFMPETG